MFSKSTDYFYFSRVFLRNWKLIILNEIIARRYGIIFYMKWRQHYILWYIPHIDASIDNASIDEMVNTIIFCILFIHSVVEADYT